MITTLKKSIFINIIATLGYIELIIILPIGLVMNILEMLHAPQFIISYIGHFFIAFLYFFPLYSTLILISNIITAIIEVKQSKTNGFIVNIPARIINSLLYNILFWIGIISTLTMCTLRLLFSITFLIK